MIKWMGVLLIKTRYTICMFQSHIPFPSIGYPDPDKPFRIAWYRSLQEIGGFIGLIMGLGVTLQSYGLIMPIWMINCPFSSLITQKLNLTLVEQTVLMTVFYLTETKKISFQAHFSYLSRLMLCLTILFSTKHNPAEAWKSQIILKLASTLFRIQ